MTRAVILMLLVLSAVPAAAQVGTLPTESPYHDVPWKQELDVYSGWFSGSKGRAGVGPQGGALAGIEYSIRLGGPVDFMVHVARAFTQREVIAPDQVGAARNLGTVSVPLYLSDFNLAFNLTGQKSYRRLIPVFRFGFGLASDAGEKVDAGGFSVGTSFSLTAGLGLRYVPGGNWSARLGIADYMYQLGYPNSYFVAPAGGSAVLKATDGTNQWTHNALITLGVSYLFSK